MAEPTVYRVPKDRSVEWAVEQYKLEELDDVVMHVDDEGTIRLYAHGARPPQPKPVRMTRGELAKLRLGALVEAQKLSDITLRGHAIVAALTLGEPNNTGSANGNGNG